MTPQLMVQCVAVLKGIRSDAFCQAVGVNPDCGGLTDLPLLYIRGSVSKDKNTLSFCSVSQRLSTSVETREIGHTEY